MGTVAAIGNKQTARYVQASGEEEFGRYKDRSNVIEWYVCDEESKSVKRQVAIVVTSEDDEGISVEALQLPGACSQGDTEKEAIENIIESIKGLVDSYSADGLDIPWNKREPQLSESQKLLWIAVDVPAT